jgi:hypothetical protein
MEPLSERRRGKMSPSVLRARSLAGFLGLIAAFALTAVHAQAGCVYNFSEYNNGYHSSDGSTLYYSVSAVDNSGCGHSDYTTVAQITSPSGRQSSSSQSGLASTASLALDGETGDYSVDTTGSFYCPFAQQIVYDGYGGGGPVGVGDHYTYYTNLTGGYGGDCTWHSVACTAGTTPTCSNGFVFGIYLQACPQYVKVTYLVISAFGETECLLFGDVTEVSGPGPCT